MRFCGTTFAGIVMSVSISASELSAQDSNSVIIQQLQRRIEELERKVQELEKRNAPPPQAAGETNVQQRVQELDQQVKILERNRELDAEAAEAKAKTAPTLTLNDRGISFSSAGGNFGAQLKGVLQVDSRTFFDDAGIAGNDGFLLRRARPIFQGTVFRDFDFQFVPDFGGTGSPQIFDAWLNYRYNAALQLQAGKFKSPIGLEQLQADRDILFNERGLPTDLVPNRDIGFELHGDLFRGVATYAAGVFNGVGDARNSGNADFEDDKAFEARLFFQPFKTVGQPALENFGLGVAGSFEDIQPTTSGSGLPATTGGSLPGYATVGQQQFFAYNPTNRAAVFADGEHWRLSPQGYYYLGPFGLLGEYVISNQKVSRTGAGTQPSARLEHTAWQVAASWVLTGEDATFNGVVPRNPFDPRVGNWGAWQLVARYSELNIDPAAFPLFSDPRSSASRAQEWSAGINWYLNRNVRVDLSYSRTTFEGGGQASGTTVPAIVTRKPENVLFSRIQLAF